MKRCYGFHGEIHYNSIKRSACCPYLTIGICSEGVVLKIGCREYVGQEVVHRKCLIVCASICAKFDHIYERNVIDRQRCPSIFDLLRMDSP